MKESTVVLVEESVRLIEDKLKSPFMLDNLAKEMYISKYHLHRLFKALTGKTLMAYVRGRRLSRSLNDLINTGAKISDIAGEYCFNYEQSYERAFKNQFGITPTSFRNEPRELKIVNMLDTSALKSFAGGIFTQPRFCFMPQLKVAGICTYVKDSEEMAANKAALSFWHKERAKIPLRLKGHIYYGFAFPAQGSDYVYMPCVEVKDIENLPSGFEGRIFPPHLYAVFRYIGFHSADLLSDYYIGYVYKYIEEEWSLKTQYQRNREYHFERMDTCICSSTYCEADVYIPVCDRPVADSGIY
jgi:AraC family transcriptional regulator